MAVILVGICIVGISASKSNSREVHTSHQEYLTAQIKNHQQKYKFITKKKYCQEQLFKNATDSKDPVLRGLSQNGLYNNIAHKVAYKFGNDFYNWSDHNSYMARKQKMSKYVDPSVFAANAYYFRSDDESNKLFHQHYSQINMQQLKSNYDSDTVTVVNHTPWTNVKDGQLQFIADIQYESWHNTDNDNSQHGNGERWFLLTYDMHTHKITKMKVLYTEPDINNTGDSKNGTPLSNLTD